MSVSIAIPDDWCRWYVDDDTYRRVFLGLTQAADEILMQYEAYVSAVGWGPKAHIAFVFKSEDEATLFKLTHL